MISSNAKHAEALAKIMFIQSMVAQIPEERKVLAFVCRGLEDLPGVAAAWLSPLPDEAAGHANQEEGAHRFTVTADEEVFGEVLLRPSDPELFRSCYPYINNLFFFVAVMLEERRQRDLNRRYERELEDRVEERTRRLFDEKERLAVTLRSIGDGVITTDTLGRVVIMNQVAEALTGWTLAEAEGRPLTEVFRIIHGDSRQPCPDPASMVLRLGRQVELSNHTLLLGRDEVERVIADSGAPIRDADGQTSGVVLVFRDETEKRQLAENAQRIERLDALGLLAGGIAHDFNNLLMGVFGHMEIAARNSEAAGPAGKALREASSALERARRLTQQLLTFARGGTPQRHFQRIDGFLRDGASFALAGSPVACEFHLPEDLWTCHFDDAQLSQVVENVVINARQAMMPEGGRLLIRGANVALADPRPSSLKPGCYVRISIHDHGPGIPAEILPRIFDPFFTTKEAGTGLGLATSHSILLQHQGGIEVESQPRKGTTVHLWIPADPAATPTAPAEDGASPASATVRAEGLILIMDDEPAVRAVTGGMLKLLGYPSCAVADGERALEFCQELMEADRPIAAIILDLTIPGGMGGLEVIGPLRALFPALPIFAATGYSSDPVVADPARFGFTASISKPFTIAELGATLGSHLSPPSAS